MPDNLTISISADTSKLRADIAEAEAELRRFNKSLRQAADVGDTAQVAQFAKSVDVATRSLAGMKRELREVGGASSTAAKGLGGLETAAAGIDKMFTGLTRGAQAFLGLQVFDLMRKGFDQISKAREGFQETSKIAAGTGFSPETVKGFQIAMRDAGDSTGQAGGALIQFAGALSDAQKDVVQLGNSLQPTVEVMKGTEGSATAAAQGIDLLRGSVGQMTSGANRMVQVFDGSVQRSFAGLKDSPFKTLEVDVKGFTKDQQGMDKALQAAADNFTRFRKEGRLSADAARAGALLFGEDDINKLSKALENLATRGLKTYQELAKQELPTKPQEDALARYNAAWANLDGTIARALGGVSFSEFNTNLDAQMVRGIDRVAKAVVGTFADIVNSEGFNTAIQSIGRIVSGIFDPASYTEMWASFTAWWNEAWPQLTPTLTQWAADATTVMENFGAGLVSLFATVWDRIKSAAQSALDAISKAAAITADNAPITGGAVPFAAGGLVPGRGTGDTVPAMLEPGEYVVRRSRVDQLGLGLLNRLNGLRASVLPRRGRTHYAEGGLVAGGAASGAPVILQIGGGSFALAGEQAVVDALVRATRRDNMLSAGRGPMRLA